jgi:hypothetical protein
MEDMKFMMHQTLTLARTSRRFIRYRNINYRIVGIRDGKLVLQSTYHSKSYDNPRTLIQLEPLHPLNVNDPITGAWRM